MSVSTAVDVDTLSAISPGSDSTEPAAVPGVPKPPEHAQSEERLWAPRIAALVALIAMAVAVDPWGLRSFTTLRWAMVSTAVGIAIVWGRGQQLPRHVATAWAVLVAAMVMGAATGLDSVTAWLGHPQRHLGVLAWVVFAAAAVVGSQRSSDHVFHRWLSWTAFGCGVVVGTTALADTAGWDPLGTAFADGRVGGLFGQPIVLATACLLLLPLVLNHRPAGRLRWLVAGSLVTAIVASQSRGAVLGLLAMAIVTAPSWTRRVRVQASAAAVAAVAGAVVCIVVLVLTPFGARLQALTESSRSDEWAVAVRVVAANPWTGVGPEGYRIAVLTELDEGYVDAHGRDVIVDRAHSAPLDVAAAGGALAIAAYAVLVAAAGAATWRLQRRDRLGVPAAAGAGAVAVFAAGAVAFPVPEIDAVAWLFAGLAIGAARIGTTTRPPRRVALALLGIPLLIVAAVAGATDIVVDHRLHDALSASRSGQHEQAMKHADAAIAWRGDQIDAFYVAAQVAAAGPTILDLDAGINQVERGLRRFPRDPALRDLHTELLVERALRSELDADITAAVEALHHLRLHDPTSLVARSGTDALIAACLSRCDNKP